MEFFGKFLASAGNGLFVQAGNDREQFVPAMSDTLRFMSHHPAALLFIQPAEEKIETLVNGLLRMLGFLRAYWTGTNMNSSDRQNFPLDEKMPLSIPENGVYF